MFFDYKQKCQIKYITMKRNLASRKQVFNSNKHPKISNDQQFRWHERCERREKEKKYELALQILKLDHDIDLTSVLKDMSRESEPMVVHIPDSDPNPSIFFMVSHEDRIKVEELCSQRHNLRIQDITEIASQVLCERALKELESCKKMLLKITCC